MHKVFIYVDSDDAAGQAAVAAAVTALLAVYGVRVLATATDAQIAALEASGLQVDLADSLDFLGLNAVVVDTTVAPPTPPAGWSTSGDPVYWLVQFIGPPLPDWVTAVSDAGAEVLSPVASNAMLVRMTPAQLNAVQNVEPVQWVGPYEPLYKILPELADETGPVPAGEMARLTRADGVAAGTAAEEVRLKIEVFEAEALEDVRAAVVANGGTVEAADVDTIICRLARSSIHNVVVLPAVAQVGRYTPPTLMLNRARGITLVQPIVDTHGLDGAGEIVGVCDTGLDRGVDNETLHTDFKELDGVTTGRVIRGYALGRPGTWNDPNGHGTHVAGIVLGNGVSLNNRPNAGIACKARLVMQSVLDAAGGLSGIPANLNTLFTPVYDNDGVRVHNNSWGTPANFSLYGSSAREVDQFVWRNPDMVIVFAAGNSATDDPMGSAQPVPPALPAGNGVVNFRSMHPEATFRNGITVGGSENQHPAAAGITLTWGVNWATGSRFWAQPLVNDNVANNAQQVMAFSCRGPTIAPALGGGGGTVDDRFKPDVMAPGSSIFAPYSPLSPTSNFWGPRPVGSAYIYKGGTSMAAPHVAGMCALIRQYLRLLHGIADPHNADRRRRRPSAALIKALLIHGAVRIQGMYPGSPANNFGTVPGNHQGWGRVDVRRSLFSHPPTAQVSAADAGWLPRRTLFIDDPNITLNGLPAAQPNSRRRHQVRVTVANNAVPLRATLVWTDFPGPAGGTGVLFNQLRLSIVRVSDNTVFPIADPAGLLPPPPGPPAISLNNNTQQIDVRGANLQAGDYLIRVDALNPLPSVALAQEEQDFALVVSGAISHSDHRNPGTMAALPDLAFIDLRNSSTGAVLHDGLAPSPPPPAGNLGSPDIWITPQEHDAEAQAVDTVEAGKSWYVHVRVHNLGFAPAHGAHIHLYWADPTSPLAYPGDWKADGFKIGATPTNQVTVDVPARGNVVAGPFTWEPPGDREDLTLLARAVHADDPITHEGNVRLDNNITKRQISVRNTTTQVQGEPGFWGKFWFWIISGFGTPRPIEARLVLSYEDLFDGQMKPVPPGVKVEFYDYDPVTGDDKLAAGETITFTDPNGQQASAVQLTFSTAESGERHPDIYCKILRPEGAAFTEFLSHSFFSNGASAWSSKSQEAANGGFYEDDFSGNSIGISAPVHLIMRADAIRVHATFEYPSVLFGEFQALPAAVPVKIMDSNAAAPQPLLATANTDEHGEIRAIVPKVHDYNPSIYFLIEKDESNIAFALVSYFLDQDRWDSRQKQGEIVGADQAVRPVSGHFEHWNQDRLVAADERLRFRLGAPRILMHLRFTYFNRETGGYEPVPAGVEVEVWEDVATATLPLISSTVGADGRIELSVPKGGKERLNLYARVVMTRRLAADLSVLPSVSVRRGGNTIQWDTKGHTATDGSAGLFTGIESRVPAAGGPMQFRIGTGAADATLEHAAPYILQVIGDVHTWLRQRADEDWANVLDLQVNLFNSGAAGSRNPSSSTLELNTAHTAPAPYQWTGTHQPDHWNRAMIAHHYAHTVLQNLMAVAHAPAAVANHRGYDATVQRDQRIAFAEGWADYVAFRHLAQYGRPRADATVGGWSASSGGSLFSAIAGVVADDSTMVRSAVNPSNQTCRVNVSAVNDPQSSAGHVVRFRFRTTGNGAHVNLTVKLLQAGNEVASWSQPASATTWSTDVRTLTPAQADRISAANYANLSVQMTAHSAIASTRRVEISWVEFEVPQTRRPDPTAGQTGWRGNDNDGSNSSGEIVPAAVATALWNLDVEVVGAGHAGQELAVNQQRFQALIWHAVQSLANDQARQVALQLYGAIQGANLPQTAIAPFRDANHVKQEVRRMFEARGMVFTRGRIHSAAQIPAGGGPVQWRFQVRPADQARLHVAVLAPIKAYRIEARRVGTSNWMELDSFTLVTHANQREQIDVNLTEARQTGVLLSGGNHDFRVRALDQFDAWDSFADDFTGNTHATINSNDRWLRNRLHTIRQNPINVV